MATKLYVGNLAFSVTDAGLHDYFSQHGNVQSASVIIDRETGRSRGFGFVEFANSDEAQAAINALNGTTMDGRQITVNEARAREERPRGGGGGFRSGGGGGGGGYRGGGGGRGNW